MSESALLLGGHPFGPLNAHVAELPPRERLIAGMLLALEHKGYAQVSVADVVREARVSKRTFYEHFTDKEDCFLGAYERISRDILAQIAHAVAADGDAAHRAEAALDAYLNQLASTPLLTQIFMVEIQTAGPLAMKARREVHRQFAAQLRAWVEMVRRVDANVKPLSQGVADALVGGINELVFNALMDDAAGGLDGVRESAREFIEALLGP